MAVQLKRGQRLLGMDIPVGAAVVGLTPDLEDRLVRGGGAVQLSESELATLLGAGGLAVVSAGPVSSGGSYSSTTLLQLNGVDTAQITIDAGAGQTLGDLRVNINPHTDVLGAMRNLAPTGETLTIGLNSVPRVWRSWAGIPITALHALAISNETGSPNYAGKAYVIGKQEADLVDAENNDARWDALSALNIQGVLLDYRGVGPGPTYQQATLNVLGYIP